MFRSLVVFDCSYLSTVKHYMIQADSSASLGTPRILDINTPAIHKAQSIYADDIFSREVETPLPTQEEQMGGLTLHSTVASEVVSSVVRTLFESDHNAVTDLTESHAPRLKQKPSGQKRHMNAFRPGILQELATQLQEKKEPPSKQCEKIKEGVRFGIENSDHDKTPLKPSARFDSLNVDQKNVLTLRSAMKKSKRDESLAGYTPSALESAKCASSPDLLQRYLNQTSI